MAQLAREGCAVVDLGPAERVMEQDSRGTICAMRWRYASGRDRRCDVLPHARRCENAHCAQGMPAGIETHRDPLRMWLWTVAGYAVAALLLTWPLARRWSTDLPLGSLPDPVVPWFNLWTLEWNADRLRHAFFGYWNAPLFHPAHDAFALSEPQGLTALLFAAGAPWLGPVGAYNFTLWVLLVLNAWAARRLARGVGVSRISASWVGMFVLALPFVQRELGVLQLCVLLPVLCGLCEVRAVLLDANLVALLRLGVWLAAALWTCEYYALLFGTLLLPAPLFMLRRGVRYRQLLAAGIGSVLVLLALSWPLLAAQRRAVAGFSRSTQAVHAGSASIWAYVQPPEHSPWHGCAPQIVRPAQRRMLYPGLGVVALTLLGARRMRRAASARFLAYCSLMLVIAWLLSFGTRLQFGSFSPYAAFVQGVLPGFAQLRSPYRAAVFVQICLALFAGFGLDALAECAGRTRVPAQVWVTACALLSLAEVWQGTQRTQRFPYEMLHEPWIPWLTQQPAGAAAMVPPAVGSKVAVYDGTVLAMLQALRHRHPIVNGYSGFFPAQSERMEELLAIFPAPQCLRALRHTGVRYVIVDKPWLRAREPAVAKLPTGLSLAHDTPARSVFVLSASD